MNIKCYAPKHEKTADYVFCCDCGKYMLVKCGEDSCPACKAIGTLMWADDEQREVDVKEFKAKMRAGENNEN